MQSYLASALASGSSQTSTPPTSSVATFLRDRGFRLCLAYFDARRGTKEGHEYEKVLAFYPTSAALSIRTGIVGLAQALASFASSFSPPQRDGNNCPIKFMEAEQKKWAMFECEPDVWLVMVVNKAWTGPGCSNETLQSALSALHSLFTLLHGPMSQLLDQDATGFFIRRVLQPFMDEAGNRLRLAEMKDPASLLNPLAMQGGLAMLPMPKQIFLGVNCLVSQLLITTCAGSRPVLGAITCWKGHLLWGSLPLSDCEPLVLLACRALGPATSLASKAKVAGQPDGATTAAETLLSPHQWCVVASPGEQPSATSLPVSRNASVMQQQSPPPSTASMASAATATALAAVAQVASAATSQVLPMKAAAGQASGFLAPKLRQPSMPVDSMLQEQLPQQRHRQPAIQTAQVWLTTLQKRCLLLPYFDGPLLVVLLLHEDVVVTQDVLTCISKVLQSECPALCTLLSRSLPRKNQWHHPGYRYRITDETTLAVRASPGNKVATLSQQSLRTVAHLSNKLQHWGLGLQGDRAPAEDTPELRGPGSAGLPPVQQKLEEEEEGQVVVACRGFADTSTWVVARCDGGKQLLVAMESVPDGAGLQAALAHAQRLCDASVPGMFA